MDPNATPDPGLRAFLDKDFHHPYEPYDIQREFMSAVYHCIEEGKVGILESPTGTGKSLSLICGSLTWLREHKRKAFEAQLELSVNEEEEPAWMIEHEIQEKRKAALHNRNELELRLARIRAHEKKTKERYARGEPLRKRQKTDEENFGAKEEDEEAVYLLDDYESEDDLRNSKNRRTDFKTDTLSAKTQALMEKLGLPDHKSGHTNDDAQEEDNDIKIFYCSRTHSQISQFVNDLRRVKLPTSLPPSINGMIDVERGIEDETLEQLKHISLASRKSLCIYPKVAKLSSTTAINERCLEIQASKDCKCPFLPTKETEALVNDFRDHALARVRDIEDLVTIGKKLEICPYYASRPAVQRSEVITLPYPLLLQKSSRDALGYSLKGQVVLIDEAHNLMDVITSMQSITVSFSQLQQARAQLLRYLQKFQKRLKGKNRIYVTQIVRLLDSLSGYLVRHIDKGDQDTAAATTAKEQASTVTEGQVDVADLINGKGTDQINLFKLARYLQESKLARKVNDYNVSTDEKAQHSNSSIPFASKTSAKNQTIPVLMHIQGFLLTLMNPSVEGRFFYERAQDRSKDVYLRYTLLDPTQHFRDIVEDARAVILAGGTMSPMNDYFEYLFSYLPPFKISTLSCGHVIPPSSLLAMTISNTLSGSAFDFKFEERNREPMILDLGRALLSFIQCIPDGVVIFFPSYNYLNKCISTWKSPLTHTSENTRSLWQSMNMCKAVFQESGSAHDRSEHSQSSKAKVARVDKTLKAYAEEISSGKGAVMLAVMGGSLSEGINFSDRLGRGIMVIGLPFPNPHSAEWKAKMDYITQKSSKISQPDQMRNVAREFYENACMRTVNQCIGRAIRHKYDYAAIMLIDKRYSQPRINKKLPSWIQRNLFHCQSSCESNKSLRSFFQTKSKDSQ